MEAWIQAHPVVDWLLQATIVTVLGGVLLVTVLFLLRLLRPSNLRNLLSAPSRAVRSFKILGQEVEFFEVLELSEHATQESLRNLDSRLTKVEAAIWTRILPQLEEPDEPDLGLRG